MAKKRSLAEARGLDNLFSENERTSAAQGATKLRLADVEPKADQPRKDFDEELLLSLSESIAKNGVIQPILVRPAPGGMYQIIAGERRWRASKLAGLSEIPAIIMEADELHTAELALIENLQRENLNPYEEAEAFRMLMTGFDLTQEEVSARLGKSRSAVANALRLLELPECVAQYLRDGTLSAGHCRALLGLKKREGIQALAERVIARNLSVRETEAAVKAQNRADSQKAKTVEAEPVSVDYVAELEKRVTGLSGRYCKISTKGSRKTVTIEYGGEGDLEALLSAICGAKITED
ncbi:MAG: ParB/RepB/Spo0J family partition protein [Ruminococcaceae bacterium]|nr:ParB/RepB/Spo0J family partition protein [Oscillospiraceae bacterium]